MFEGDGIGIAGILYKSSNDPYISAQNGVLQVKKNVNLVIALNVYELKVNRHETTRLPPSPPRSCC